MRSPRAQLTTWLRPEQPPTHALAPLPTLPLPLRPRLGHLHPHSLPARPTLRGEAPYHPANTRRHPNLPSPPRQPPRHPNAHPTLTHSPYRNMPARAPCTATQQPATGCVSSHCDRPKQEVHSGLTQSATGSTCGSPESSSPAAPNPFSGKPNPALIASAVAIAYPPCLVSPRTCRNADRLLCARGRAKT